MNAQKVLTPEQVKAQFRARGLSLAQWARDNGYKVNRVYRVLNGFEACTRGISHEIAVKLGIKANPDKTPDTQLH